MTASTQTQQTAALHTSNTTNMVSSMKSTRMTQEERRARRRNYKLVQKNQRAIRELYYKSLGNAPANIYHMPEDLWVNILSYLPTVNMLRMMFVSRLFHYLLSDPRYAHVSESFISLYNDSITNSRLQRVKMNSYTRVISRDRLELYHSHLYRKVDFGSSYCKVLERKGFTTPLESGLQFEFQEMADYDLNKNVPNFTEYDGTGGTYDACIGAQAHAVMNQETLINLILAQGQHIEELILNGCDAVTDFIVHIIVSKCVKLKRLELRSCMNITEFSRLCVVNSPLLRQSLEYFDFSESPMVKMANEEYSTLPYLKGFQNLKQIVWFEADYYEDMLMELMDQADKELDKDLLHILRERRNTVSDKSANHLETQEVMNMRHFHPLPRDPTKLYHLYNTVESIRLTSHNYFNFSPSYLPALTQKFKNLREVQLSFSGSHHMLNIDDRVMKKCWSESKKNTKMKHLTFEGQYEDQEDAFPLREFLSLYPGLESFTCSSGVIFSEGDLSHFFKHHQNLRSLQCEVQLIDLEGAEKEVGRKFENLKMTINISESEPLSEREEKAQHLYNFLTAVGPQLKSLEIKIVAASKSMPLTFGNEIVRIIGAHCTNLKVLFLENLWINTPNSFIKKICHHLQRLTLSQIACLGECTPPCPEDQVSNQTSALQSLTILNCERAIWSQFPTQLPSLKFISIFGGVTQSQFDRLISPENAPRIHSITTNSTVDTIAKISEYTQESPTIALRQLCCPTTTPESMEQIIKKAGVGLQMLSFNLNGSEDASSIGIQLIKMSRHLRYLHSSAQMSKYEELRKEFEEKPWQHIWKLSLPSWTNVVGDYYDLMNHREREITIY